MHQFLIYCLITIAVVAAALTIGQIWFDILSWAVAWKAFITLGILFVLIGFLMVVKADFGQHKKLKDENYLD
ncbi:MAG: hypothetical protein H6868_06450 [Rhodospirillales bacterium]|nr:hypothetical protein [Rhodospirillales bacterium]